jgi:hypothetical protein
MTSLPLDEGNNAGVTPRFIGAVQDLAQRTYNSFARSKFKRNAESPSKRSAPLFYDPQPYNTDENEVERDDVIQKSRHDQNDYAGDQGHDRLNVRETDAHQKPLNLLEPLSQF